MFRRILNRLGLTLVRTGGLALRSDSADLYLDGLVDSRLAPELILLRSTWL